MLISDLAVLLSNKIMGKRGWLKMTVLLSCVFAVSLGRELKVKHKDDMLVYSQNLGRVYCCGRYCICIFTEHL
ncbi:hypothetical protein Nepgr_030272 [Nepenthes gracilis]|uniref:Uncharacterized protein n=1 Tax=Nepenthes gracilis TaxID=150966 RepID=A0AAD3TG10_NEPGR|nr:hypothetical protein Nepgr_030272 [Nepenthes gracilis]